LLLVNPKSGLIARGNKSKWIKKNICADCFGYASRATL